MPPSSASEQQNTSQHSPSSGSISSSTSSPSTSSTSSGSGSGSDSVSFEMAPDTILDGISKAAASASGVISSAVNGTKDEARASVNDKDGVEGEPVEGGKENGQVAPVRARTGPAEVSKIQCKRCAARDLVCEVRPGCRACDRCGKMKTRCSLSELSSNIIPTASPDKAENGHPRPASDSRKRKRSSMPSNTQAGASQLQRQNSESPGIDSDTAHMLLGGSSDAEEASDVAKRRKKHIGVNGGGIAKGASANQTNDISYRQSVGLPNGEAKNTETPAGKYGNVSGFKSVNRDEGAGVAALLRATAEADRHMSTPQATGSARRKVNKAPQLPRTGRQSVSGSGTGLGSVPRSSLGSGTPTLASLGLEDEQSKTRALAKLLVTVEQLQLRVTELEAAQFRAMEKVAW